MATMARSSGKLLAVMLALCVTSSTYSNLVSCRDPDEVLDFCVAVIAEETAVWQTGTEDGNWQAGIDLTKAGVAGMTLNATTDSDFPCKDPVSVNDFVFKGLGIAGKVTNKLGSIVTSASVTEFPALNTLGISAARVDFVKNGLNEPHFHPRATEVIRVLEGSLVVGFVDTANTLFLQTLQTGDVFVFPEGTLHFQFEVGYGTAAAIAFLNSQNPGRLTAAEALLDSNPGIDPNVVESAFMIDQTVFGKLKAGVAQSLAGN